MQNTIIKLVAGVLILTEKTDTVSCNHKAYGGKRMKDILEKITRELKKCKGVEGVVLGGSRATGTATETSDIDIGIYYKHDKIDYKQLNEAATKLDDEHRENLICKEGEWGKWVNFGGWLTVDGTPVDLIFRDLKRVQHIIEQTEKGEFKPHYQTGHPHAYLSVMYRGELAVCQVLYSKEKTFRELKKQAENYPQALQAAVISFFRFEAGFSCMLARKSLQEQDSYYVTGHLFRAVSALNQVIFAINSCWCLNEKKAVRRIDGMENRPSDYSTRIEEIFRYDQGLEHAVELLEKLMNEVHLD